VHFREDGLAAAAGGSGGGIEGPPDIKLVRPWASRDDDETANPGNQIFAMAQRSIVKDSAQLVRGANPLALPHHEPAAIVLNLFLWFHARGRTQFAGPKIAMIPEQSRNPSS